MPPRLLWAVLLLPALLSGCIEGTPQCPDVHPLHPGGKAIVTAPAEDPMLIHVSNFTNGTMNGPIHFLITIKPPGTLRNLTLALDASNNALACSHSALPDVVEAGSHVSVPATLIVREPGVTETSITVALTDREGQATKFFWAIAEPGERVEITERPPESPNPGGDPPYDGV